MNDVTMPDAEHDETGALQDEAGAQQVEIELAVEQLRRGGNWFYWLAGLSMVNSLVAVFGGEWRLLFGLGITQFVDGFGLAFIAEEPGSTTIIRSVVFVINLSIACAVASFGLLANKARSWVFMLGMVIYVVDALLLVLIADWLSVAFHVWVLFALFGGLKASLLINKMRANVS